MNNDLMKKKCEEILNLYEIKKETLIDKLFIFLKKNKL